MVEAEDVLELCGSGGKWSIGEEGWSTSWHFGTDVDTRNPFVEAY